jgi:hypothetical protein
MGYPQKRGLTDNRGNQGEDYMGKISRASIRRGRIKGWEKIEKVRKKRKAKERDRKGQR